MSSIANTTAGTESHAARILRNLFAGYQGNLEIRLWDGTSLRFGQLPACAALVFRDPLPLTRAILARDPLQLVDGHIRGAIDIEGDMYMALEIRHFLSSLKLSWPATAALLINTLTPRSPPATRPLAPTSPSRSLQRRLRGRNTKDDNREAIAFHYDASNDFYRLWLDENMVYSCAYFEHPNETLDRAQRNKLDYICRKLRLKSGERLLDIGCGWGALVIWAARHYGVSAHGITLSRNQYDYARQKIAEEQLDHIVSVELRDYRDLGEEARFDKIVSVGMFEHVGLKNLPLYFQSVNHLLRPGGLFLNHGITHDVEGWQKTFSTRFINRYVFPDGELDTVSNVQRVMEQCGFEIHDVEGLRTHYALTLRHWVERLEKHRQEALTHVPETIYRIWRLYMAASALHFEDGDIGVYQILASRRARGLAALPMTRRDLYDESQSRVAEANFMMLSRLSNNQQFQSSEFSTLHDNPN